MDQDCPTPTPLAKKLGLKPGQRRFVLRPPDDFFGGLVPDDRSDWLVKPTAPIDFVHAFCRSKSEAVEVVAAIRPKLAETGMIWISWPKKASGMSTNLTEDGIREIAFAHDLVDVKVCSVDATWSALKLVIRVALRKAIR
jgi:hypothetical protein